MKIHVLLFVFFSCNLYAQDAKMLAQKSGCLACHSIDKKVLGPALSQIAAKYKNDPNYLSKLVNKVKHGGSGVWGPMPMPSNSQVKDEDIVTLVNWIVKDIQPSSAPLPTTTVASTAKSDTTSGSAVLGVIGAVAGVYLENQASKSNSRSRNARVSQTVPQIETRARTSQSNYPPSENSESYSSTSPDAGSTSENRPDNPAALVNECISIKPGGGGLKNNCGFKVYYSYCTLNGIYNMVNKCEQNKLGTAGMGPYDDDGYSSLAGERINWFACKSPSMPKQTDYNYQQKVITGYCSN